MSRERKVNYDFTNELQKRGFVDISIEKRRGGIDNKRLDTYIIYTCAKHNIKIESLDTTISRNIREYEHLLTCPDCKSEFTRDKHKNEVKTNEDQINCNFISDCEYKNEKEEYSWKCRQCNHEFIARFRDLKGAIYPCKKCKTNKKIEELQKKNITILGIEDSLYSNDNIVYEFIFGCCGTHEKTKTQTLKDRGFVCKTCNPVRVDSCSGWLKGQNLSINLDKYNTKSKAIITCKTCDTPVSNKEVTIEALKKRLLRSDKEFICCSQ